jgi:exonuclease III
MKIIFWNSNGWEQDRCNKIAEVAFEEDADVICITDARMDPNREAHVKGYEKILDRITGKKWRIRMTCRPGKRKGCFVGGSLLMTSHNCANVRRVGLVKYGVVDKAEMIWLGQKVTVISTYGPYENDAKGSLRSALKKEYEGNFEDKYWDSIRENTRKGRVVIGGDFNMTGIEMDNRLRNYGLVRSDIGEGYTFKAEIGGEEVGRVIDHALTRELACEARATENGRFLRDHIPLIASVEIRGVAQKKGKRLAQIVVPMIRAGDSGARRRLEKEMEKNLSGDLVDWSHEQIVMWTANKAKEIAKNRNRKDNPDGWSPLTRLMRLRVKILGALFRRLDNRRSLEVCYPLYKETKKDMLDVELSQEEEEWLNENGVERTLPDWLVWKRNVILTELVKEIKALNKLTSSKMRKE